MAEIEYEEKFQWTDASNQIFWLTKEELVDKVVEKNGG